MHADDTKQSPKDVHRDPDYYFEDGSAVILVQNMLFKVHRTILSRDSSAFETLFRLPSGKQAVEGTRDSDPVILQGDTPEQFRSLLWSLYSLPHEIVEAGPPQDPGEWHGFDRFSNLTQIAHKYCFKSLEIWSLGTFLKWLSPSSRQPPPRIHTSTAMSLRNASAEPEVLDRLQRVLELAVLCEDELLHDAVVQRLLDELRSHDADLPWFIGLGERFNIQTLSGAAYYALMIQGREKWLTLAKDSKLTHDQLKLTREQLAKLHNGYYALVSRWERYRSMQPTIPPCVHYGHSCRQRWQAYWKELTKDDLIMTRFPADVLGKLETVLSQLYAYTGIMDMHQECRGKAVQAVRSLLAETKDGLAANFVDLP
ncbi:hypothetical protein M422DRAFT_50958 [Sphaerobolus stellatus SS14]|uniref:BTB domain-containing protein n=1 Tax=Sphaerobolus stellatus (strain SS14) TaxID=990650 RepID=A0A0C9U1G1_SPHS4|nr:hypothetical protein M422DRAFT_50958 [Sphaerobolus stellatus SS14]